MSEEKIEHKDGRPWENVRVFATFQEADILRKNLSQDTTQQVKVKKQVNTTGQEIFVVKKRKVSSLLETVEQPVKEKKKNSR